MMQLEEQCGFICYDLETVPRYIKQKKKKKKEKAMYTWHVFEIY